MSISSPPYEHQRPAQYSTPGLPTTAHTLHVHPAHWDAFYEDLLTNPTSEYQHIVPVDLEWLTPYMSILHTGTPSMKTCWQILHLNIVILSQSVLNGSPSTCPLSNVHPTHQESWSRTPNCEVLLFLEYQHIVLLWPLEKLTCSSWADHSLLVNYTW